MIESDVCHTTGATHRNMAIWYRKRGSFFLVSDSLTKATAPQDTIMAAPMMLSTSLWWWKM